MNFLYRTDVHANDKSPQSWKADYPAEIWESLRQVGELARQHNAEAVLDGGDFFHTKAASRNTHGLVATTARIHQAYPCPVWTVEGNHDVQFNNLATLPTQPLGVLIEAGVFHLLRNEVFTQDGLRVRVVGMPYSPIRTRDELRAIQKQPGDDFLICLVHGLAGLDPPASVEDFFGEPVFRYEELLTGPGGPDVWCFGHWHKDQGIEILDGKHFVNCGALSRGSLQRENLTRTPKAVLIELSHAGISTRALPLVVAPGEDVFDLEKKAAVEAEAAEIDAFLTKLQGDPALVDAGSDLKTILASLNVARDIGDLAAHYLELAGVG